MKRMLIIQIQIRLKVHADHLSSSHSIVNGEQRRHIGGKRRNFRAARRRLGTARRRLRAARRRLRASRFSALLLLRLGRAPL